MAKLFIGVDIGTSSIKVAVVEVDPQGRALVTYHVSRSYPAGRQRDAGTWSQLARTMVAELNPASAPAGIGFSGQMHSLIPLDEMRRSMSPTMLWCDMQGLPRLQRFVAEQCPLSEFVERTGNLPLPDFTLAKWLYLRNEKPDLADGVRYLPSAKDYVRWTFDPGSDLITDPTDAAGTQVYNLFQQAWDPVLIKQAEIPASALGIILPSAQVVGKADELNRQWAGTPLVNGAGDQAACGRAVGAGSPGQASLSLGTSGVLAVSLAKTALPDGWTGDLHIFPGWQPDMYQVIATIPALGSGLSWAASLLGVDLAALDDLAREGSEIDLGGEQAGFFPFLDGMGAPNPDSTVRAAFYGLSSSMDRRVIAWIIYQGFAMEIRMLVDAINAVGVDISQVTLSGGASQLPTFAAAIAAYLPVPCRRASARAGSAVGAALIAADTVLGPNTAWLDSAERIRAAARPMDPLWLARRSAHPKPWQFA